MEQVERAAQFLAMHHAARPLVLANVWDAGSAAVVASLGFSALATTSCGLNWSLGYPDGETAPLSDVLSVVARIVRVVNVPVTVDLVRGYGRTPAAVMESVRRVLGTGAVGVNIEDGAGEAGKGLRPISEQARRLEAARQAATSEGLGLVLNARTDVFIHGVGEPHQLFDQVVERAHAYGQAGADGLFTIGAQDRSVIGQLVQAVGLPLNVMVGPRTPAIADLAELGVARVSTGGGFAEHALSRLRRSASELLSQGTYRSFLSEGISYSELNGLMTDRFVRVSGSDSV